MRELSINIAGGVVNLDVTKIGGRLLKDLRKSFAEFIDANGEDLMLLKVILSPRTLRNSLPSSLKGQVKDYFMMRSSKRFPFDGIRPKRLSYYMGWISRYAGDERFLEALSGIEEAGDRFLIYPGPDGVLILREGSAEGKLFLKGTPSSNCHSTVVTSLHLSLAASLPRIGGSLLHGVGLKRNGKSYLFLGLSREGKTTVAKLTDDADILSDDEIVIKEEADRYFLYATPFGRITSRVKSSGSPSEPKVEVNEVLFLAKDTDTHLIKLRPAQAMARTLLHHIHFFSLFGSEAIEKSFSLCHRIFQALPAYELRFQKNKHFWKCLDRELRRR